MEFSEYQQIAAGTAVYRDAAITDLKRVMYCAMGLGSEAGEVLGAVKRIIRDDKSEITMQRTRQIVDEISDCLWYCAMLAYELEVSLDDIAQHNVEKLRSRFERGVIQGEGGER